MKEKAFWKSTTFIYSTLGLLFTLCSLFYKAQGFREGEALLLMTAHLIMYIGTMRGRVNADTKLVLVEKKENNG